MDEQDRSAPEEGPAIKKIVRFVAHGMPQPLSGADGVKEPAPFDATEAPRVSRTPGAVHSRRACEHALTRCWAADGVPSLQTTVKIPTDAREVKILRVCVGMAEAQVA